MQKTTAMIPCAAYHYSELPAAEQAAKGADYAQYTHRLMAIATTTRPVELPLQCIERSSLSGADLGQIQLFNEVFIPESNVESLRIIFHDLNGLVYTCAPTVRGTLRVLTPETDTQSTWFYPNQDADADMFFAASTHTIVHDYKEMRSGRYFHVGVSFLPTGPIFMPMWMCSKRLERNLAEWRGQKLEAAKRESLLAVRGRDTGVAVRHVVPRPNEKHDSMTATPAYCAMV